MQKQYTILNMGAGIQTGAIYGWMADGEIPPADVCVFADTQEEPAWVYRQLAYLDSLPGPPIRRVTAGKIGEDLQWGRNSTGQRFASIPAYTTYTEGQRGGMTRRQCTREYKIEPIEKWIRQELLGLQPRQRIPDGTRITSLFGFSTDEPQRAVKMRVQFDKKPSAWLCDFPCFHEDILATRRDCQQYIEHRSGFQWRSSRCVFCPMQRNHHWQEIQEHDPEGWRRAVQVDEYLRTTGAVANRDMNEQMYVHRQCVPLSTAVLEQGQQMLFDDDGGCDQGCFL